MISFSFIYSFIHSIWIHSLNSIRIYKQDIYIEWLKKKFTNEILMESTMNEWMNEWNLCGSHAQTRSTQKKWQKKDLSMIMSAVFDCLTLPFICDSFFHSPQNKTKKSSKARNLIPTKRKKKIRASQFDTRKFTHFNGHRHGLEHNRWSLMVG